MIPKKAHFIWTLNQPMSFMRYSTLLSFSRMNPDWSIYLHMLPLQLSSTKVWEEDMYQEYLEIYRGEDYTGRLSNLNLNLITYDVLPDILQGVTEPAAASDLLSWQLLADEGGAYFDMDILFIMPLESFYKICKDIDFIITYGHSMPSCTDDYFSIGVMMSGGNNSIFKTIAQLSKINYNKSGYQSAGVKTLEKHYGDIEGLSDAFPEQQVGMMPMPAFYALDWRMLNLIFEEDMTTYVNNAGSYGIHWYGGSALAQSYIKKINHVNYRAEHGTLFKKMIEVLG